MAIVEREPDAIEAAVVAERVAPERTPWRRPMSTTGPWSWFTTIDHKKIGKLYGYTAFAFFIIGGIMALVIRLQLARPNGTIVGAEAYNQLMTMHGVTMIFLVVMPMSAAFANYLVPLQIGARDVAFPRLNAFGFWCFLVGGLFLYSSFLLGGGPNGGWFAYAPNTSLTFSPGHGMDFYTLGLQITGIASLTGAINLIVTTLNMRAPGMSLMRMPVFTWMSLVTQFLLLFALPIITVALFLLMFDRQYGTHFFDPAAGGDPVLWQHLFWLFGHPEVYILILPAMGIVSEILPVFSRKPLFGYPFVVFSGVAIGFMGWGVWAHHMFTSGLGPVATSAFGVSTMLIAVPTGVKIFNWLGTIWGGSIRLRTPLLFSIGFVTMFVIGGLSGVTHAIVPADTQQTDTYYIVAHFHYVLFGGAIFALFGGMYYWWPKMYGYTLREGLGKWHFWLMMIGFNATFGPFHVLGLQGMPRRIYRYDEDLGFDLWNLVATLGAFLIAASVLVFIANVIVSARTKRLAGADPWDARTLEWNIPSPVPEYNFDVIPEVHALDDFWHQKYGEDEQGRAVRRPDAPADANDRPVPPPGSVHLPSPSYFPLVVAIGLPIIGYGVIYNEFLAIVGAIVTLAGMYGWALEPSTEPGDHGHDGHDAHGPDDHGDGHAEESPVPAGSPA